MKQLLWVLAFLLCLSANAQRADTLLSLSLNKAPFEKFVETVEADAGYRFFYVRSWVDTVTISCDVKEVGIRDVLKQALKGSTLQYYVSGDRIILTNNVPIIES